MKTTRYFEEQVLRKRPYIARAMCQAVIDAPMRRDIQEYGPVRYWGKAADAGDGKERILRAITLDAGETVHNAFFDRNFRKDKP
ncbi:MAG TPA: hypothetical protein VKY22_21475 [Bradyrhizobium sp.]|jgi:hypothetical protein|nr:hypothetical protein [Bradyrhizobium sp.]